MTEASYLWTSFLHLIQHDVDRDVAAGNISLRNASEYNATLRFLIAQAQAPLSDINESHYRSNNRHHTQMLNAVSTYTSGGDLYEALDQTFRKYLSYELLFGWPTQQKKSRRKNKDGGEGEGGTQETTQSYTTDSDDGSGAEADDSSFVKIGSASTNKVEGISSSSNGDGQSSASRHLKRKNPFKPAYLPSQTRGQVQWMLPNPNALTSPTSPDSPNNGQEHQHRGLLRVELHHCPRGVLQNSRTIFEDAMRVAKHYVSWSDKRFEEEDEEYLRAVAAATQHSEHGEGQHKGHYHQKLLEYKHPRKTIRKKFVLIAGGDKFGGDNTMRQWKSADGSKHQKQPQQQGEDTPTTPTPSNPANEEESKHSHKTVLVETHGKTRYQVNPVTEWVKKTTFADTVRNGEPSLLEEDVWVLQCTDMDADNTIGTFTGLIRSYVTQVGKVLAQNGKPPASSSGAPQQPPIHHRRVGTRPHDSCFSSSPNADTRVIIQVIIAADFSHQTVKTPTALAAIHSKFLGSIDKLYSEMIERDATLFPSNVCQVLFRVEIVVVNAPVAISNPEDEVYGHCARMCRELFLTVQYPCISVALDMPATAFFCGVEVPMWGTGSKDVEAVNILFARVHRGIGDGSHDAARIVIHRGMDVSKDDHLLSTVADRHTEGVALNNLMFHFWAVAPSAYRSAVKGSIRRREQQEQQSMLTRLANSPNLHPAMGASADVAGRGQSLPTTEQQFLTTSAAKLASSSHNSSGGLGNANSSFPSVGLGQAAMALANNNRASNQRAAYDPEIDSTILRGYRIYRSIVNGVGPMLRQLVSALHFVLPSVASSRNPSQPSNAPARCLTEVVTIRRADPAQSEFVIRLEVVGRRMAAASSAELLWGIVKAAFNTVGIHVFMTSQSSTEVQPAQPQAVAASQPATIVANPLIRKASNISEAVAPHQPSGGSSSVVAPVSPAILPRAGSLAAIPIPSAAPTPLLTAKEAPNNAPPPSALLPTQQQQQIAITEYVLELVFQPFKHFRHAALVNNISYLGPLLGNGLFPLWDLSINLRVRVFQSLREANKVYAVAKLGNPSVTSPLVMNTNVNNMPSNNNNNVEISVSAAGGGGTVGGLPQQMVAEAAASTSLGDGVLFPIPIIGDYDDDSELEATALDSWLQPARPDPSIDAIHPTRLYNWRMERRAACSVYIPIIRFLVIPRAMLEISIAQAREGNKEHGNHTPPRPASGASTFLMRPVDGEDVLGQCSFDKPTRKLLGNVAVSFAALVTEYAAQAAAHNKQQMLKTNEGSGMNSPKTDGSSAGTPSFNSSAFPPPQLPHLPLAEMLVTKIIDASTTGLDADHDPGCICTRAPAVEVGLFVDFNELSQSFNCDPSGRFLPNYKGYSLSGTASEWAKWLRALCEHFTQIPNGSYRRAEEEIVSRASANQLQQLQIGNSVSQDDGSGSTFAKQRQKTMVPEAVEEEGLQVARLAGLWASLGVGDGGLST